MTKVPSWSGSFSCHLGTEWSSFGDDCSSVLRETPRNSPMETKDVDGKASKCADYLVSGDLLICLEFLYLHNCPSMEAKCIKLICEDPMYVET